MGKHQSLVSTELAVLRLLSLTMGERTQVIKLRRAVLMMSLVDYPGQQSLWYQMAIPTWTEAIDRRRRGRGFPAERNAFQVFSDMHLRTAWTVLLKLVHNPSSFVLRAFSP